MPPSQRGTFGLKNSTSRSEGYHSTEEPEPSTPSDHNIDDLSQSILGLEPTLDESFTFPPDFRNLPRPENQNPFATFVDNLLHFNKQKDKPKPDKMPDIVMTDSNKKKTRVKLNPPKEFSRKREEFRQFIHNCQLFMMRHTPMTSLG